MSEGVRIDGIRLLSEREAEIVALAADGNSDKQISAALGISQGTLGTYWARIRQKCGMRWRTEIVAAWVRNQAADQSEVRGESQYLEGVLNSIALSLSVMDGRGVVNYGNDAFYDCLAESGLDGDDEISLAQHVQFEDGRGLAERLQEGVDFSAVASVVRQDGVVNRRFLRVWRLQGCEGQFVGIWEPIAPKVAVQG